MGLTLSIRASRQVAAVVRESRVGLGWSREELAERAGTSATTVWRIEAEQCASIGFGTLFAVLEALGIEASMDLRAPRRDRDRRQRDPVHALVCGYVARRLRALGWEVELEVEIGVPRHSGWIDLMAYHAPERCLFISEVKSEIHDAGAVQRTLHWYERESWAAAHRLGWHPILAASALLVVDTAANDERLDLNQRLFAHAFPTRAKALGAWLAQPSAPAPDRGLALVDPSSRRRQWLRATRTDGRRTPNAAADYRDVLRRRGIAD